MNHARTIILVSTIVLHYDWEQPLLNKCNMRRRHKHGTLSTTVLPRFLYSDEVQIGPETVMTTLYTAKKYAVPALEAHCVEFLKKNLRADNAFMLLTQVS